MLELKNCSTQHMMCALRCEPSEDLLVAWSLVFLSVCTWLFVNAWAYCPVGLTRWSSSHFPEWFGKALLFHFCSQPLSENTVDLLITICAFWRWRNQPPARTSPGQGTLGIKQQCFTSFAATCMQGGLGCFASLVLFNLISCTQPKNEFPWG